MLFYFFTLNLTGWQFMAFVLAYMLAIFFAFCLHELSHGAVAYWCGDKTAKQSGRLTLNPFRHIDAFGLLSFLFVGFGWAKPVPVNPLNFRNYKRGIRLVSMSGVITNLILGFLFSCLYYFVGAGLNGANTFLLFVKFFLSISTTVNISLAVFNLFPIYPLDGFNFLSSFLSPNNKFVQFMYRYGGIILLIFVILPVFDTLYYFLVGGIEDLFQMFWGLF